MLAASEGAGETVVRPGRVVADTNIGGGPGALVAAGGGTLQTALVDYLNSLEDSDASDHYSAVCSGSFTVVLGPVLISCITLTHVGGVGRPPYLVHTVGVTAAVMSEQ